MKRLIKLFLLCLVCIPLMNNTCIGEMNIYHDYDSRGELYFYTDLSDITIGGVEVSVYTCENNYNGDMVWYFTSTLDPFIESKDFKIYYGVTIGKRTKSGADHLKSWIPKKLVKGMKYCFKISVNDQQYEGSTKFIYDPVIKESK